jgi:hypothetical protein
MRRAAAAFAILVGVLLAGCGPSLPIPHTAANPNCGDPCAAMVCPSGSVCNWNNNCQAHCEPQPLPSSFGH